MDRIQNLTQNARDAKFALLVAIASFLCLAVTYGNIFSSFMYLHSWEASFAVSEKAAVLPGSVLYGSSQIVGPFASILCTLIGFRIVTFTGGLVGAGGYALAYYCTSLVDTCFLHGMIIGVGLGLVILPATIVVNFYFTTRARLATCLCLCGASVGQMIFPQLVQFALNGYREGLAHNEPDDRWRYLLFAQGGTVLLCCLFGLAFRPHKKFSRQRRSIVGPVQGRVLNRSALPLENKIRSLDRLLIEHLDLALLKSPTFVIFTISGCIKSFVVNVPATYITERILLSNFTGPVAHQAMTMMGAASLVGRITCGLTTDHINTTIEQNTALILAGISTIMYAFLPNTETLFLIFLMLYGFSQGIFNSLRSLMVIDLLGLDRLNNAFGLSSLFQGIPLMVGPTIIGFFNPVSELGMDKMFYFTGGMLILASVVCFPLNWVNRWETKRDIEKRRAARQGTEEDDDTD